MVDTQIKIGNRIKEAIFKAGYSNRDAANMMEISENALYKIFHKDHVSTQILYQVSELFGIPITFFFEVEGDKRLRVRVEGDKNLTIAGETNFFSETEYRNVEKNSENRNFEQQFNMMQIITEQKDRIIAEKDRIIEEKERFIQHLIAKG
jgi:transcriptional regulator with XRE-family HTH domain